MQSAERLTLGVLMSGVMALALSDFVSPLYWSLPTLAALLRWWRGPSFALSEMQASFIGWFGFLWVGIELILGRAWVVAFTDFMLILALAVTIEAATPRNHLHRMLTGLFLMLAGAVLTDSVLYALPLAALMWFTWRAASCLYGLQQPGGDLPLSPIRHDLRTSSLMLIITLALFVMLPRFDIQTKLQPTQPRMATTGFSSQVQLGDFARDQDRTVMMRVESPSSDAPTFRKQIMGRYWRGVTLSLYHHHSWQQRPSERQKRWNAQQRVPFQSTAQPLAIAIFREASDHPYIMLPDGLTQLQTPDAPSLLDDLGQFHFDSPPHRRLRLAMQIAPISMQSPTFLHTTLSPPQKSESNQATIPPAIVQWMAQLGLNSNPLIALQQLTDELRSWQYDLHTPLNPDAPLASFIRQKRGHCELYATTLALSARALGIPARIINGYYGGEWNETGGFLILRQEHAHSWVEAWVDGQWQRIDPTPTSRWQPSGTPFPTWDAAWETVKLNWYRYILEFQDTDREAFFKNLLTWFKALLPWLSLTLFALFAGVQGWRWLKRSQTSRHTLYQHQRIIDSWLLQHGVQRQLWQPLATLPTPQGMNERAWHDWLQAWEKQVYASESHLWNKRELKKSLRQLASSEQSGCSKIAPSGSS